MKGDSRSAIREIKDRLDIVEIARRYVELKPKGSRWMGLCPFHQEKTGSFSVNREEGLFYCFGCQAAGDVIDFYGRINGLEFKDALRDLAKEAGVELASFKPNPREKEEKEFREVCLSMYAWASEHFRRSLAAPGGQVCREYIAGRRLAPEVVDTFGLGWSGDDWHGLENFLKQKGYSPQAAADAGLLSRNDRGRIYDRFRERLMFPISDLSGRVIAFGGRILSSGEPKYINSSDTAIYKKGDHLYGLAQARRTIAHEGRALLTEGYMDVLSLHQFGYTNACGVLGTSLTSNQVQRLAGFCSTVDLIFDGDRAGRKAAMRSSEMILQRGLGCRVLLMPEGEDVDSILQNQGRDAFEAVLADAVDGLEFCLSTVREQFSPREIVDWVKDFAGKLIGPDLLPYFVPRFAQGLGLAESELREMVAGPAPQGRQGSGWSKGAGRKGRGQSGPVVAAEKPRLSANTIRARELLRFVVWYPHHIPLLEERGAALLLTHPRSQRLWDKLKHSGGEDILPLLDEREKSFFVQCQLEKKESPVDERDELESICLLLGRVRAGAQGENLLSAMRNAKAHPGQGAGVNGSDEIELLRALQESLGRKNG